MAAALLTAAIGSAGAVLGKAPATEASPTSAGSSVSPYFGRWRVEDTEARFSTRGRAYKMIDIAPCGRDFCGVAVAESGACGSTLFRFLSRNRGGENRLLGHGVWGTAKKNVTIDYYEGEQPGQGRLELNLGNGHDFSERGGSMPMFNARYVPQGAVQCRTR